MSWKSSRTVPMGNSFLIRDPEDFVSGPARIVGPHGHPGISSFIHIIKQEPGIAGGSVGVKNSRRAQIDIAAGRRKRDILARGALDRDQSVTLPKAVARDIHPGRSAG